MRGREYEALNGQSLPVGGFDDTQTPTRLGNVESIRMRGGKSAVVRRFDPASAAFTYTRLGRQFFSRRRTEYVVSVPAGFWGTRTGMHTREMVYSRSAVQYRCRSP